MRWPCRAMGKRATTHKARRARDSIATLANAPWLDLPATRAVFACLTAAGFRARAVGGTVRNALLGLDVTDIDIATDALPERVMEIGEKAGFRTIPTGLSHGTVMLVRDGTSYEVTTLRRDVATDGRHAEVAFTSDWHADAARRDFTINALYCDADGTVFDPLGGMGDLKARRVRFIGSPDDRIREDYLRILRFFRFSATYAAAGFDRDGLDACARNKQGLARLSAERVRSELLKVLVAGRAVEAVEAMLSWGLLTDVIATPPRLKRFAAMVRSENDLSTPPDALRRLAALALHVDENTNRLRTRLRLANDETEALRLQSANLWCDLDAEVPALRRRLYEFGADVARTQVLHALSAGDIALTDAQRSFAFLADAAPPVFPLKGADLIAAGFAPGPQVGERLKALETAWIASDFSLSRDALLKML